jgi:outer membrane lipopolysaccharide assembly protein LptE/RlpB
MRSGAIAVAVLVLSSCGYHVSGHANLVPKTIKVIAVPEFANSTTNHRLPVLLTADVTRELISRTHYTVVTDPDQADAYLRGVVARFDVFPIIFDPTSGRATSVQIVVTMQLTLTDRQTGKVLYSRAGAEFRERYEISIDPQQYFDESGTAIERVSRDVARSMVSGILENF